MKKINNKGFMMAETLAVTVVVLVIFASIYASFMPTKGEYEKRINYNDVNSQYAIFYMRKYYIDEEITVGNNDYVVLFDGESCTNISDDEELEKCTKLAKSLGIKELILTNYNLSSSFKNSYNGELDNYINYLPEYKDTSIKDDEGWSFTPCSGDFCETLNIYRSKKVDSIEYSGWSDWSLTACDEENDELCEKISGYKKYERVEADYVQKKDVYQGAATKVHSQGDLAGNATGCTTCGGGCNTYASLEITGCQCWGEGDEYTITYDRATASYGCSSYCINWSNAGGFSLTDYYTMQDWECPGSTTSRYDGYCCGSNATYSCNCTTCSANQYVGGTNNTKCYWNDVYSCGSGTYLANTNKCYYSKNSCASGYTESNGKCYSNYGDAILTDVCASSNTVKCDNATIYRTRTKTINYSDEWEEWSKVKDCTLQEKGTCDAKVVYRDTRDLYRLIIKTKHGYATTSLLARLKNDNTGPTCDFVANNTSINKGESATYILNCIDTSGFDIDSTNLTTNSFLLINDEENTINDVTLNISLPTEVDNGYKYTLTITTTSSTTTSKLKLRLNEEQIRDAFNNYNTIVDSDYLTIN